jgi:hypothetical protein
MDSNIGEKIPVVTVCETLNNLSLYNGKSIILIGRFVATSEGSWISDDDCEPKITTKGYVWDSIISVGYSISGPNSPPSLPANFKWDERLLLSKLKELNDYKRYRIYDTYVHSFIAIFGRLNARLPLKTFKDSRGILNGDGFGHENGAPAQIISNVNHWLHELVEKEQELEKGK